MVGWTSGVAEGRHTPDALRSTPEQTIVRGVLAGTRLTADGSRQELRDAAGRKVMTLKPGANDVSRLAPGVYFVRVVSGERSALRKVIVTR